MCRRALLCGKRWMDPCVGRADEKSYSVISRGCEWTSEWVQRKKVDKNPSGDSERKGRRCSCRCAWKRFLHGNLFFLNLIRPTLNKIFVYLSLAVGNKRTSISIHTPVCPEALSIIAKPKLLTYPVNSRWPHLTQQFSPSSKEECNIIFSGWIQKQRHSFNA